MMDDDIPEYWGVGFFGENIFRIPDEQEYSDEELREMYPEWFDARE